jgi:hypothetical protein
MTPGARARRPSELATVVDLRPEVRSKSEAVDARTLRDAVRATVAYADVFGFSLSDEEIHRDLVGVRASRKQTRFATECLIAEGQLVRAGDFVTLPGREELAEVRRGRRAQAEALWPLARRFGRILGTFPFVRLVAVTGSLAADNPDPRADLDYLIVAAPGRLWLVRAMAVGLVRLVRVFGVQVCPNYLLTTRALHLDRRDLFTAHELLQAVPVVGAPTYRRLRALNAWTERWLPNRSRHYPDVAAESAVGATVRRIGERVLGGGLGDRLEAWERGRKQARFSAAVETARFTADVCEGHFGQNRHRALRLFEERCAELGIGVPDGGQ